MKVTCGHGLRVRPFCTSQNFLPRLFHGQIRACQSTLLPWYHGPRSFYNVAVKRSVSSDAETKPKPKGKKDVIRLPAYHLTPSLRDESGEAIWPAPKDKIEGARRFIPAKQRTLIVPDKDADGLSSGAILQKTLVLLGLDPNLITTHLLQKGNGVRAESERKAMSAHRPAFIFVLDMGSAKSAPVIDGPHRALVIDHHWSAGDEDFPAGAEYVTAFHSPPVATSSLLTYHICAALHPEVESACGWLCAVGTHGDLGNNLKWEPPFPDMKTTFKKYTKSAINDAVMLINAARRAEAFDVPGAWKALTEVTTPAELREYPELQLARTEVSGEISRWARAPPRFSTDGRFAVIRIHSTAQVHPLIATRWAGYLNTPKLEVVLVANDGYLPNRVNFSCRATRHARSRDQSVNIIDLLREVVDNGPDPTLRKRLGDSFARGHKEASGGIVGTAEFLEFLAALGIPDTGVVGGRYDRALDDPNAAADREIEHGDGDSR